MRVAILRLGHRKKRDERLTTHVGLVARAFGANEIIISGERDATPINTIKKVTKKWGGPFKASFEANWKKVVRGAKKKGAILVHLTMYGEPLLDKIDEIRKVARKKDLLVMAGAEKVPGQIFLVANYNIAVTSQPHSEAAAVAVFLHELFEGREMKKTFRGAKLTIQPQARGKRVKAKE